MTNKIYPFLNGGHVYDEASEWIAKLDRGLTEKEKNDFQNWILNSTENRKTLFSMARIWDKMDALSCLSEIFPEETAPADLEISSFGRYVIGAGIVLFVSLFSINWVFEETSFSDIDAALYVEYHLY